ncbi:hypothetical protein ACHWQZ_G016603 [Mnemiopsis leidyi]
MTHPGRVCKGEVPTTDTISRLNDILKLTGGMSGNKVALLNCESGVVSLTADFSSILAHIQEEDILTTFYRNMIASCSIPDLKTTLTRFSMSLLLKILPFLSNNTFPRTAVLTKLSQCFQTIEDIIENSSFKLSIANTAHLRGVISAVICPKISKLLSLPKQRYLISLVLEAYISCISSNNYPNIRLMTSSFYGDVTESRFYHGIILPLQRSSNYVNFCGKEKLFIVVLSCCIPHELESFEGETFTFIDVKSDMENIFVDESIKVMDDLLRRNSVDVVCCQKVVHHRVKEHLKTKGIMVLDRLSVMYAEDVASLCGTHLSPSISQWNVGVVKSVDILELERKKFLHFKPIGESHFGAIILHSLTESVAAELEICMKQSINICNNAFSSHSLTHGASCLFSTLLDRLSSEPSGPVISAVSAALYELCPKENVLVCGDGHTWEVEQSPSEDIFLSDRIRPNSHNKTEGETRRTVFRVPAPLGQGATSDKCCVGGF